MNIRVYGYMCWGIFYGSFHFYNPSGRWFFSLGTAYNNAGFIFVQHLCVFLGQLYYLENCILSTPQQMPQTITNIPRCLPQILTVPKFWYHLAHSFSRKNVPFDFERAFWEAEGALSKPKGPFFRENEAQEMTPKLLALAKVCSVLGNIRDVSWHLSKRGSELEKRCTFSILDKNGAHKNKACSR